MLVGNYNSAVEQRDAVASQIEEKEARKGKIERFIREIEEREELVNEFDPALWAALVENVTVGKEGRMSFLLTSGVEVE